MSMFYAGVGSRQTPQAVLALMTLVACALRVQGYTLRSGHADGADLAFEKGAKGVAEIMLPWSGFNSDTPVQGTELLPEAEHFRLAKLHHPAWDRLKRGARALHARNVAQVLGHGMGARPSSFLVCWTSDGKASGGTGQAIRVAQAHNVPVFNLHDRAVQLRMCRMVRKTIGSLPAGQQAKAMVMLDELEHTLGLVDSVGNVLSHPAAPTAHECDADCGCAAQAERDRLVEQAATAPYTTPAGVDLTASYGAVDPIAPVLHEPGDPAFAHEESDAADEHVEDARLATGAALEPARAPSASPRRRSLDTFDYWSGYGDPTEIPTV